MPYETLTPAKLYFPDSIIPEVLVVSVKYCEEFPYLKFRKVAKFPAGKVAMEFWPPKGFPGEQH
jgi:hypothetical protein